MSGSTDWFQRSNSYQTRLAEVIAEENITAVRTAFEAGAAATIFVKGYTKESILCTLPQARQPASSVIEHRLPLNISNDSITAIIDDALASHIEGLPTTSTVDNISPLHDTNHSAIAPPPFTSLPAALKVGDRVKR